MGIKIPTRFPTIIGLIALVIVISGFIKITDAIRTPSQASPSWEPSDVRITNVSDASFTVSWVTQDPVTGALSVTTPGKPTRMYYDERDLSGKIKTYLTHSVSVRDAKPSTQYMVKLLSNNKQFLNNGKPYIVSTPTGLSLNSGGMDPAYGTIKSVNDTPVDGALVYLNIEGGQELSTISKPSGVWLIPLNQARTNDLTSFLPIQDRMTEHVTVLFNNIQASAITDTLNDSPVPEMMLGRTYDFRKQQANINTAPLAQKLPISSVLGVNTAKPYSVTVTSPKPKQALATTLPLFTGTGIPNTFIGISIGMKNPISGSAKVDQNGLWSFTPQKHLPIGIQNFTVTSKDIAGKPVAITQVFEILKSGTQVLGDATPSATLAPTETETPIPTGEPTVEPTAIPTAAPPPTSGNDMPTILLITAGLLLFLTGSIATIR